MKLARWQIVALILLSLVWLNGRGVVAIAPAAVDQVAIIYETGDSTLPSYVIAAARELAERGIDIYLGDDDALTGDDQVPKRLAKAIEAARENGLPAMVTLAGGAVRQAVDLPATKEAIVGVVR